MTKNCVVIRSVLAEQPHGEPASCSHWIFCSSSSWLETISFAISNTILPLKQFQLNSEFYESVLYGNIRSPTEHRTKPKFLCFLSLPNIRSKSVHRTTTWCIRLWTKKTDLAILHCCRMGVWWLWLKHLPMPEIHAIHRRLLFRFTKRVTGKVFRAWTTIETNWKWKMEMQRLKGNIYTN